MPKLSSSDNSFFMLLVSYPGIYISLYSKESTHIYTGATFKLCSAEQVGLLGGIKTKWVDPQSTPGGRIC